MIQDLPLWLRMKTNSKALWCIGWKGGSVHWLRKPFWLHHRRPAVVGDITAQRQRPSARRIFF
jgi:hypothetical protein